MKMNKKMFWTSLSARLQKWGRSNIIFLNQSDKFPFIITASITSNLYIYHVQNLQDIKT